MTSIGRNRMSECSAVVRLQVVHPVPAFLFFNFFEKMYSKMALRIPISIGGIRQIESSKRNLRFPLKKNG